MFIFVFYYQGAQGDDPITAGIKLAPMAIGMLVASPLAGIWADRHGSRVLAALKRDGWIETPRSGSHQREAWLDGRSRDGKDLRKVQIAAPRGTITDKKGRPLCAADPPWNTDADHADLEPVLVST